MSSFNLAAVVARMNNESDTCDAQRLLKRELNDADARELGSGAFGTVYQHPTDKARVIKFSTDRDAYYMFMRWCGLAKNKNNPFLPKLYAEHVIKIDGRVAFVHDMEHLERPLSRKSNSNGRSAPQVPRHVPDTIIGTFWKAAREITADNHIGWRRGGFTEMFPTRMSFIKKLRAIANKRHKRDHVDWPLAIGLNEIRVAKPFINTMYDLFTDFSGVANLDFHGGNIMLRPGKNFNRKRSGTIVITDPVSEIYDSFRTDTNDGNVQTAITQWLKRLSDEKYIDDVKQVKLKTAPTVDLQAFMPVANIAAYGVTDVACTITDPVMQKRTDVVNMASLFEKRA